MIHWVIHYLFCNMFILNSLKFPYTIKELYDHIQITNHTVTHCDIRYFHIFFGHKLACLCLHEMCIKERSFQSDLKNICTGTWGRSEIGFIRCYPCPFLALRLQNREWIHYRGADIRIYIIKYRNDGYKNLYGISNNTYHSEVIN